MEWIWIYLYFLKLAVLSPAHQGKSSQVKSYSPGEHGGSAQRKPQGPARRGRVVGMHAAAPASLWAAWDECTRAGAALLATFSLNRGFLPRSCCAFAHSEPFPFSEACFQDFGRPGTPAPRAKSREGIPPGLLWSRRAVRSPHDAVWKAEGEGLASLRLQRPYPAPGACSQLDGLIFGENHDPCYSGSIVVPSSFPLSFPLNPRVSLCGSIV